MLVEKGVPLDLFARLTDAQIDEVYGHPRDDEGRLKEPPAPPRQMTLIEALMEAEALMVNAGLSLEEQEKGFALVRAKYEGKEG